MIQVDFKMNHAANVCLIANGQFGSYVVCETPRAGGIFFRFMSTHAENEAVKNDEMRRQKHYAGSGRILPCRYVKVR